MTTRRTAAEIVGFHFGWDIRKVQDTRYQSTRYANPAVYVIGDDYYCAPSNNQPPKYELGQAWTEIAEHYGRKIFESKMIGKEGRAPCAVAFEPDSDGIQIAPAFVEKIYAQAAAPAPAAPNHWWQTEEGIRLHFQAERHHERSQHNAKIERLRTDEMQFIHALRDSIGSKA